MSLSGNIKYNHTIIYKYKFIYIHYIIYILRIFPGCGSWERGRKQDPEHVRSDGSHFGPPCLQRHPVRKGWLGSLCQLPGVSHGIFTNTGLTNYDILYMGSSAVSLHVLSKPKVMKTGAAMPHVASRDYRRGPNERHQPGVRWVWSLVSVSRLLHPGPVTILLQHTLLTCAPILIIYPSFTEGKELRRGLAGRSQQLQSVILCDCVGTVLGQTPGSNSL